MSGKRKKLERKFTKTFDDFADFLAPILDEAREELDHDQEDFTGWLMAAMIAKQMSPELCAEDLLPHNLQGILEGLVAETGDGAQRPQM